MGPIIQHSNDSWKEETPNHLKWYSFKKNKIFIIIGIVFSFGLITTYPLNAFIKLDTYTGLYFYSSLLQADAAIISIQEEDVPTRLSLFHLQKYLLYLSSTAFSTLWYKFILLFTGCIIISIK